MSPRTTHRQHSRVLVRVDSHTREEPIDISKDVIQLTTQKATKARGRMQIHLVARRNYLNLIFPDDVINIYLDPGDGKRGFVRTMFGYVDRIERSEVTDDKGGTATRFVLICSDFQKAIEKTHIYFNAFLRQVLDERFARTAEQRLKPDFGKGAGASALRNAGLLLYGSPADLVENFLMLLLGFGQQWRLPPSYSRNQATISANRRKRVQRAKLRIPQNVREALTLLGFSLEDFANQAKVTELFTEVERIKKTLAQETLEEAKDRRDAAKTLDGARPQLLTYRSALETEDASYPAGIIDLLNLDFIEALAIDGYIPGAPIAQSQNQTLAQWLYGQCNEVVNELIFDLRPVSLRDGGLVEGEYSTEPDELGLNVHGTDAMPRSVAGVQYAPAVVFREYPYSVVEKIDLSDITIIGRSTKTAFALEIDAISGGELGQVDYAGVLYFGPIFAKNPNVGGRHTYQFPTGVELAPHACYYFPDQRPVKHIDAVVITNADVQIANLGRSDEDTWNLIEMYPRSAGIPDDSWRGMTNNFSPIINQISLARHGLRVREETTKYARRSVDSCKRGGAVDDTYIRQNLVRWQIMMDHWFQHNVEYLSGTITMRGLPEIRVGYRLDWSDRNESYYVESVEHKWTYPGALSTTVSVTRGQRNDPWPVYIPPVFLNDDNSIRSVSSGNRGANGRLGKYFQVKDPFAVLTATDREGPFAAERNETDTPPDAAAGGRAIYPDGDSTATIEDFTADQEGDQVK